MLEKLIHQNDNQQIELPIDGSIYIIDK